MNHLESRDRNQSDALKLIAIICMVVDHVGAVFFPHEILFRMIGRMALPIFAYQLSQGATYTSNLNKYMLRLFIFAVVSQIPSFLLWDTMRLNIMFVLLASLVLIHLGWKYSWIFIVMVLFLDMDYGIYGVMISPLLVWFKHNKHIAFTMTSIATFFYCWYFESWLQLCSIFGFVLILYVPMDGIKFRVNKFWFYWFYPVHLLMLWILKTLL